MSYLRFPFRTPTPPAPGVHPGPPSPQLSFACLLLACRPEGSLTSQTAGQAAPSLQAAPGSQDTLCSEFPSLIPAQLWSDSWLARVCPGAGSLCGVPGAGRST